MSQRTSNVTHEKILVTSQDNISAAYSNQKFLLSIATAAKKIVLSIYKNKIYTLIANQTPSSVKQNLKVEQRLDNLSFADSAAEIEILDLSRESLC